MTHPMKLKICSNGLGSQSIAMLIVGTRGEFPVDASITGDTGWEQDCLWSNGRRTTAKTYFVEVVVPLCAAYGITAHFVRSVDKSKVALPNLIDHVRAVVAAGKLNSLKIPLFGSKGGRMRQVCTDKWKIRAIHQEARRMGAKHLLSAQGIHAGEIWRRARGKFIGMDGKFSIYQDTVVRKGVETPTKWCTHFYPLADLKMNREDCQKLCLDAGVPYIVSSQCDGCPHKDLPRWERTAPETLHELSELEKLFNGEFFFTSERIPLLDALEVMRKRRAEKPVEFEQELDFGCKNNICGV